MANLFATAKTIDTPKTAAKKVDRSEVTIKGLQQYAELKALQGAIAAVIGTMESEIKEQAFDLFMEIAEKTHKAPASFNGVEGIATVNLQMRKRGTNSPLNEGELAILTDAGIKAHEETSVQELFAINPAYATDSKLLARVSKALERIVPEDFIVKQEKKAKMVVSNETLEAAFAAETVNPDVVRVVTTLALKPKLSNVDIDTILDDVRDLLGDSISAE
jgi:hypothetical protein